jgi:uncharacterized protein YjbJ (UPF0337 family)
MMTMNEDIVKGKWKEIKGRIIEQWGKLTDNDLAEIEGKGEKLLGLLQKKYGYIRDKTEVEYKDSDELVEITGHIREIMAIKKDFMPISFIIRYGQPRLAKKQKSQITRNEGKPGYVTDRNSDTRPRRRTSQLASQ